METSLLEMPRLFDVLGSKNIGLGKLDCLDDRVKAIVGEKDLDSFEKILRMRGIYADENREDVSIYPRVISKGMHRRIERVCREITKTAFQVLSDYIDNPSIVPSSRLNDLLRSLPMNRQIFSGNARYDFLKEEDVCKLVEMNFVNAGAIIEATETAAAVLQLFPSLNGSFYYKDPDSHIRSLFTQQGIKRVLFLTEKDYSDQFLNGRAITYLQRSLAPIEAIVLPESKYNDVVFQKGSVFYGGQKIDGIYLRGLASWTDEDDSLFRFREFCSSLLRSNVFILDNFITMLLEDKDLRFLNRANGRLKPYIPRIFDRTEIKGSNYSDYVLKQRDMHWGKGVVISPESIDVANTVIQERIYADKFPVLTIEGKKGDAVCDTAVYVSYSYDHKRRMLLQCDVSGYLTRFSLEQEIVNISCGGGIIPTLIER